MNEEIKLNILYGFFEKRPAVVVTKFSTEAGISHSLLKKILRREKKMSQSSWDKLKVAMRKYGYNVEC